MMKRWARFVTNTHWMWVIGWPVVALAVWLPAPRVSTLLADDDTGFLPDSCPSVRAQDLLRREFPGRAPLATAAIVAFREAGLTDSDRIHLDELAGQLVGQAERLKWTVHATAVQPYLRPILETRNHAAAMIVVDLPAAPLTQSSVNRVREIQRILGEIQFEPGIQVELTGSAILGELLDANAKRDVDLTTVWAFVAVMVILLVIYKSPIAMLLPVATIGVSLLLVLGLLGWAATMGLPLNGLVQMFIIVILVGSGVDYCLFLFSRLREKLSDGLGMGDAVEASLAQTGGAILASAGTNAAALAVLILADNRDLYTSGPTIAIAICIATFAVVTLVPSLLQLVGHALFWPRVRGIPLSEDSRAWSAIARFVVRHPVFGPLATLVLLAPLTLIGARAEPLFDALDEYPADTSLVRGARLYQEKFFGADGVSELSLLTDVGSRVDAEKSIAQMQTFVDLLHDRLSQELPLLYQRDLRDPLGVERRKGSAGASDAQPTGIVQSLTDRLARDAYLGRSGHVVRVDLGLALPPRSAEAMDLLPKIQALAIAALGESGLAQASDATRPAILISGETATYRDMRELRRRDFRVVAGGATVLIFIILLAIIGSIPQSLVLVGATLLTYSATYGASLIVFELRYGLSGLNWQIDFLLFIIIMSLGQDYNILVATRIGEERRLHPPEEAVERAVRKTGKVVSSCGLIMAATFASLLSASLIVMKQFAVAFALGILLDTFVVRPVLVPSLILLLSRGSKSRDAADDGGGR